MTEDLRKAPRYDYMTGALLLIHEARREMGHGNLRRSDECLAVAERMAIMAGAQDIGQLQNSRDLPDNVFKRDSGEGDVGVEDLPDQLHDIDDDTLMALSVVVEEELDRRTETVEASEGTGDD